MCYRACQSPVAPPHHGLGAEVENGSLAWQHGCRMLVPNRPGFTSKPGHYVSYLLCCAISAPKLERLKQCIFIASHFVQVRSLGPGYLGPLQAMVSHRLQ